MTLAESQASQAGTQGAPQEATAPGSRPAPGQQGGGSNGQSGTGGTPPASGAGAGSGAATGSTGAETGKPPGESGEPDYGSFDENVLLEKHPRLKRLLDSRVGDLAQKQALPLARQMAESEYARFVQAGRAEEEARRRAHLRSTDTDAFARYDEEQEARWRASQEAQSQAERLSWQRLDAAIGSLQAQLPPEVQHAVGGKTYASPDGNGLSSRLLYLQAILEAAVEHGVTSRMAPALTKARAEMEESFRLAANGQANGAEPRAPVDGGVGDGRGDLVSQAEFDAHGRGFSPAARAWRKANAERLSKSYHRTITR